MSAYFNIIFCFLSPEMNLFSHIYFFRYKLKNIKNLFVKFVISSPSKRHKCPAA